AIITKLQRMWFTVCGDMQISFGSTGAFPLGGHGIGAERGLTTRLATQAHRHRIPDAPALALVIKKPEISDPRPTRRHERNSAGKGKLILEAQRFVEGH